MATRWRSRAIARRARAPVKARVDGNRGYRGRVDERRAPEPPRLAPPNWALRLNAQGIGEYDYDPLT